MMPARLPKLSIADALRDSRLFEPHFRGPSWDTWRVVLKAAFGEPLTDAELEVFHAVAGRDPPIHRVKELVCAVGRGGGKDSITSFVAAYVAMSFNVKAAKLRPGELAYIVCLATDKDQAGIVFRYIAALFETIPTLRAMVKNQGSDSIELRNHVVIEVRTNSYRSIRGRSVLCAIFDEASFWRDDRSQNPDTEVHGAISPGLARVDGSMLIMISTTHRRAGLFYEHCKSFLGHDDPDVLVVKGTTLQFNPTADRNRIAADLLRDPARYHAEYNSEWRDDLSTFLSRDLIDAAVDNGVLVRPPVEGTIYRGFCDASGARRDSFTMAIAHREPHNGGLRVVVDLVYEKRVPFSPSETVDEIVALLRRYKISTVDGDNWGAELTAELFRQRGVEYHTSKRDKAEIYLELLPMMRSGEVRLLDHARATAQFAGLARRTLPGGRDRVDHETGGHDDIANAIAGAIVLASADREQHVPFVAPIAIYADGTSSADHELARATAPPPAPDSGELDLKYITLRDKSTSLQQDIGRLAEPALTDPAARAKRDRMMAELKQVDAEWNEVRKAMAQRSAAQAATYAVPWFSGGGSQYGGSNWGIVDTRGRFS
jgi:hypothetical protein